MVVGFAAFLRWAPVVEAGHWGQAFGCVSWSSPQSEVRPFTPLCCRSSCSCCHAASALLGGSPKTFRQTKPFLPAGAWPATRKVTAMCGALNLNKVKQHLKPHSSLAPAIFRFSIAMCGRCCHTRQCRHRTFCHDGKCGWTVCHLEYHPATHLNRILRGGPMWIQWLPETIWGLGGIHCFWSAFWVPFLCFISVFAFETKIECQIYTWYLQEKQCPATMVLKYKSAVSFFWGLPGYIQFCLNYFPIFSSLWKHTRKSHDLSLETKKQCFVFSCDHERDSFTLPSMRHHEDKLPS